MRFWPQPWFGLATLATAVFLMLLLKMSMTPRATEELRAVALHRSEGATAERRDVEAWMMMQVVMTDKHDACPAQEFTRRGYSQIRQARHEGRV
jgi:hypothetical protein